MYRNLKTRPHEKAEQAEDKKKKKMNQTEISKSAFCHSIFLKNWSLVFWTSFYLPLLEIGDAPNEFARPNTLTTHHRLYLLIIISHSTWIMSHFPWFFWYFSWIPYNSLELTLYYPNFPTTLIIPCMSSYYRLLPLYKVSPKKFIFKAVTKNKSLFKKKNYLSLK